MFQTCEPLSKLTKQVETEYCFFENKTTLHLRLHVSTLNVCTKLVEKHCMVIANEEQIDCK